LHPVEYPIHDIPPGVIGGLLCAEYVSGWG